MTSAVLTPSFLDDAIQQAIPALRDVQTYLNTRILEHEDSNQGILLALISRTHMQMVSEPGEGKSLALELLAGCFNNDLSVFTKQLGPTMTFSAMTGLPHIPSLRDTGETKFDETKRIFAAQIVQLDEWNRAGDAFRDEALTWMVQRTVESGGRTVPTPLMSIFGASNSLPAPNDAFYSRFVLRYEIKRLSKGGTYDLLTNRFGSTRQAPPLAPVLGMRALQQAQWARTAVEVPPSVIEALVEMTEKLTDRGFFIPTRTKVWAAEILQAHALLSGRTAVDEEDLDIVQHVFWSKLEEQALLREVLAEFSAGYLIQARALADDAEGVYRDAMRASRLNQTNQTDESLTSVVRLQRRLTELGNQIETLLKEAAGKGRDTTKIAAEQRRVAAWRREVTESI